MFNWLKRGDKIKVTQESVTEDQLKQFCGERGWNFFADRESMAGFRDAEFWVAPTVSIAAATGNGEPVVLEDQGCDFVLGNEMAVRFCVCTVEREGAAPLLVYVARNWKRLPPMTLVHLPSGAKPAQNALTHPKLSRSYVLQTDHAEAANQQITKAVEAQLGAKYWNLLVKDDWLTCHYNGRPNLNGIDALIEQATQFIGGLPH
ncbi:MAG TPA: hypothetical protein VGO93_21310, partial [Candidatus Xenobia bacterium]